MYMFPPESLFHANIIGMCILEAELMVLTRSVWLKQHCRIAFLLQMPSPIIVYRNMMQISIAAFAGLEMEQLDLW